jgi:hypothetical protein
MERYKQYFREDCTLEEQEKGLCELPEDCPYKPASNGRCGDKENNNKLKGQCQDGWQWSAKDETCYKVGDNRLKNK